MELYQRKILLKRTGDSSFEIGDPIEYFGRPHMCETCGKRFTLPENLNRHQMIHTDERPFVCSFCKKRFRLAQHLKEHIRIHTGEKPYKCPTCSRAFCQISNLKSHQKTHTKIKAFKCNICEKSFRRSFTLKQHKLTHTRRSYSETVGGIPNFLPPGHPALTRKMSAPTPMEVGTDNFARKQPSVEQNRRVSLPCFNHIDATGPPTTPTSPLANHLAPFVKPEAPTPEPPSAVDFPSLSALLQSDTDTQRNQTSLSCSPSHRVCSADMMHFYQSLDTRNIQVTEPAPEMQNPSNINSPPIINDASGPQLVAVPSDYVTDHGGNDDKQRDSAYSSYSDISSTSSPHTKKRSPSNPSAEISLLSPDVKHVTSLGVPTIKDSLMQRVKELALRSLGKSSIDCGSEKESLPASHVEEISQATIYPKAIHPDVDHFVSETNDIKNPGKGHEEDADSRKTERKYVKRASDGSRKWKRQLCKEWYEVPHSLRNSSDRSASYHGQEMPEEKESTRQDTTDFTANGNQVIADNDCFNGGGESKAQDAANCEGNSENNVPQSAALPVTGTFNFSRFAPIVEWKPVVIGWQDLVCGTLYAVPPQVPPDSMSTPYPICGPNHLQPHPPSVDSISTPGDNSSSLSALGLPDTGPRYFRFSPNTIESFALGFGAQTPVTPETGSSGVYSNYYPTEGLPIPGYSRLQHALLYQWDTTRARLGGTSSVSKCANLIPAT